VNGGFGEESPRVAFGGTEPDGNYGGGLVGVNGARSSSVSRDLAGAAVGRCKQGGGTETFTIGIFRESSRSCNLR
jgi:hypothetical protein